MSSFPKQLRLGTTHQCVISFGFQELSSGGLLRFIIPPFQRPEVWTDKQKKLFIESLWLGLPVGTYTYNQSPTLGVTDNWLIDGQQRWSAIRDFVEDKVVVFDDLKYSDMTVVEKRQFNNIGFSCTMTQSDNKNELYDIYVRLAYGGSSHSRFAVASKRKRA